MSARLAYVGYTEAGSPDVLDTLLRWLLGCLHGDMPVTDSPRHARRLLHRVFAGGYHVDASGVAEPFPPFDPKSLDELRERQTVSVRDVFADFLRSFNAIPTPEEQHRLLGQIADLAYRAPPDTSAS